MKKYLLVFGLLVYHAYINIALGQKNETMRRELTLENYVPGTPITLFKDFQKIDDKDVPENTIFSMPTQLRYLYKGEEEFTYLKASVLHLMLITDLQGKLMAVIAVCEFDPNIVKRLIEYFGKWRVASRGGFCGETENLDELSWYTWYLKENYVTLNQKRFGYRTHIHYVLSFHFPYDSIQKLSNITKLIYLNKDTFLPEGIIKYFNEPTRKTKYFKFLKDIVINESKSKKPFKSSYLFGYEELAQRGQAKHLSHLLYNKAPTFKLRDMEGNWISLNSFEGKVVLLDFWATWCKPCITSLPKVEAIHEKYKDQGLVILGILKDVEKRDQAENIIENAGSSYKTLLITPSVEVVYRANKIPQYVIVNKKGVITYADSGFSNDIESHIQKALAE